MTAPDAIHELVAKFAQHRKEYQSHKNETELRSEFLDPFFEALGWDVFNRKSYSERQYLRDFPVYSINFSNPKEEAQYEQMFVLVETMLALHQQLASAKTPQEKEILSRQIAATEVAIDRLVYELYGLTEEEIRIVEGVTK